jgi:hypothetical protein
MHFKYVISALPFLLMMAGCTAQKNTEKIRAEARAEYRAIMNIGKLNDGIPLPGTDLSAAPPAITSTGKINRTQIELAARGIRDNSVPSASLISDAEKAVAEPMFDPAAVTFRNVGVRTFAGKPYICGQFNAKNRLGGYVGYQDFLYGGKGTLVENGDTSSKYYQDLMIANYGVANEQIRQDAAIQFFCAH